MITEEGSVKTARIAVAPALELYRKKLKIFSVIALIIGAVGIVAYIALSSVLEIKEGDAPRWADAFLIFAVPFVLGLVGYITIRRLKSRENKENRTSEFTFYADCFLYSTKTAYQAEISNKFLYSGTILKRENEKYGYIEVVGKAVILPFCKENLEISELNAIRKQFGQNPNGETQELKNYTQSKESQRGIL